MRDVIAIEIFDFFIVNFRSGGERIDSSGQRLVPALCGVIFHANVGSQSAFCLKDVNIQQLGIPIVISDKNPTKMQRNRSLSSALEGAQGPFDNHVNAGLEVNDHANSMRAQLLWFYQKLQRGELTPKLPTPAELSFGSVEGHFHLACELFLQVEGWTRFWLPHEEVLLEAGQILVMPSKLLHAETVGPAANGAPFRSIVAYAQDAVLTCHISREVTPGHNRIGYLESRPQVAGVQHWLNDAAKLHRNAYERSLTDSTRALVMGQISALVMSAVAGILVALDDTTTHDDEPPQVKLAKSHIQNQLGDAQLSVAGLAALLGCSTDHLSRLFHQSTGEHLIVYINRLRMARAAHLLRESNLSAKEIAWTCGFVSQSYFIRRFREHFSVTPKAWRGE